MEQRSASQATPTDQNDRRNAYWRRQIRRTTGLLIVWALVGFGMSILGVRLLNGVTFNGMPFGFWMAQQGAIIVFVLLILAYAVLSQRADNRESS